MREHYEAAGRIAAAAIANGDNVVDSYNETESTHGLIELAVSTRLGSPVRIVGRPTSEFFRILHTRRYSRLETFSVEDLPSIEDARQALVDSRVGDAECTTTPLSYQPDGKTVEYYDGIQTQTRLYPYADSFSLKEYAQASAEVVLKNKSAMKELERAFDIRLEPAEAEPDDDTIDIERGIE
jgi:hypothetical protein